jgi:DNA repair exonuclease SbcCD nuclease subunit
MPKWISSIREADIDRVVVTGDLFHTPDPALRDQYLEFRGDVQRMTPKSLIVIPGNHDVRVKGNLTTKEPEPLLICTARCLKNFNDGHSLYFFRCGARATRHAFCRLRRLLESPATVQKNTCRLSTSQSDLG